MPTLSLGLGWPQAWPAQRTGRGQWVCLLYADTLQQGTLRSIAPLHSPISCLELFSISVAPICNRAKLSEPVLLWISFPITPALKVTYLQLRDAIAFPQGDLENLQGANEGCQPGQALLATSTHPDQQSISSGGLQDTVDAAARLKHPKPLINHSIFLFLCPLLFNTYFIHSEIVF